MSGSIGPDSHIHFGSRPEEIEAFIRANSGSVTKDSVRRDQIDDEIHNFFLVHLTANITGLDISKPGQITFKYTENGRTNEKTVRVFEETITGKTALRGASPSGVASNLGSAGTTPSEKGGASGRVSPESRSTLSQSLIKAINEKVGSIKEDITPAKKMQIIHAIIVKLSDPKFFHKNHCEGEEPSSIVYDSVRNTVDINFRRGKQMFTATIRV